MDNLWTLLHQLCLLLVSDIRSRRIDTYMKCRTTTASRQPRLIHRELRSKSQIQHDDIPRFRIHHHILAFQVSVADTPVMQAVPDDTDELVKDVRGL